MYFRSVNRMVAFMLEPLKATPAGAKLLQLCGSLRPVARAAAAAALGYGYLLAFPVLTLSVLLSGDVIEAIGAARTVGDYAAVAAWIGVATVTAMVTVWLARLRPSPPPGYLLQRREAPELFAVLDELRRDFATPVWRPGPTLHRVCITSGQDVQIIRTPQFGFPVLFTNTLAIGLPVLQTLGPQQFKAILARRIGQFQSPDGVLQSGLYHLRQTWQCYAQCDHRVVAPLRWILRGFYTPYAAFFARASAAASKDFELAGDAYALQVMHHEAVREGIVALAITEYFLNDKFWPAVNSMRGRLREPPHLPFGQLEQAFRKGVKPDQLESWLKRALRAEAPPHMPQLAERIDDLGGAAHGAPAVSAQSAAHHFLAEALTGIVSRLDQQWWQANQRRWRRHFKRCQKARPRLMALQNKAGSGGLSADETRELVKLARAYLNPAQAAALYERLSVQHRTDAGLQLSLGRLLLKGNDARGVAAVERAMALDERYADVACKLISRFRARTDWQPANARCRPAPDEPEAAAGGLAAPAQALP